MFVSTRECQYMFVSTRECQYMFVSTRECQCMLVSTRECKCMFVSGRECQCMFVSTRECQCLFVSTRECQCMLVRDISSSNYPRIVYILIRAMLFLVCRLVSVPSHKSNCFTFPVRIQAYLHIYLLLSYKHTIYQPSHLRLWNNFSITF